MVITPYFWLIKIKESKFLVTAQKYNNDCFQPSLEHSLLSKKIHMKANK